MDEIIYKIKKFLTAQQEAETRGEHDFACPLCGGDARWERAPGNGHLHCACGRCGIKAME